MRLTKFGSYSVLGFLALVLAGGAILANSGQPGGRISDAEPTLMPVAGELGPLDESTDAYILSKTGFLRAEAKSQPSVEAASLVSFAVLMVPSEVARIVGSARVDAVFLSRDGIQSAANVTTSYDESLRSEGVTADCRCVYGVAIGTVPLSSLDKISQDPKVRLVDISTNVTADLRSWQLRPILPDEVPRSTSRR